MSTLEVAIGVTVLAVAVIAAVLLLAFQLWPNVWRDDEPDAGLSIFDRSNRLDATNAEVAVWGQTLRNVHIAPSPLIGPRHSCDEYATLIPGYQPLHRAAEHRTGAASPLVHADTVQWDGPDTAEFRRLVGLGLEVPVLRDVLRPEGQPTARWAQRAVEVAQEPIRGRRIGWLVAS